MVTEESVPGQPPWQLVFPPWWGYSNYGRGISLTGGGVGWQSINTQRALPPPPALGPEMYPVLTYLRHHVTAYQKNLDSVQG